MQKNNGAVADIFLTLKPQIRFNFANGRFKPVRGMVGNIQDAVFIYGEMVKTAKLVVRQNNILNGLAQVHMETVILGQVLNIAFLFEVADGEVVVPENERVLPIIHRHLRQLFN